MTTAATPIAMPSNDSPERRRCESSARRLKRSASVAVIAGPPSSLVDQCAGELAAAHALDDAAVGEHQHAVSAARDVRVVRHHNQRQAVRVELFEQLDHLL